MSLAMQERVMTRSIRLGATVIMLWLGAGCATTPPKPVEPPPEPKKEEPKVEAPKPEPPKPPEFEKAYFAYNQAELSEADRVALKKDVELLLSHPDLKVSVDGHCDERGTDQYNVDLGWKRAYGVRDFLRRQGIDDGRLFPISYGRSRPAVVGTDEAAWSKNRRVELSIRP